MPIIQVNLLEGRTVEQKRELARRLTEAAVEALGVRAEQVRVLLHQMAPEDFAIAGVTALDRGMAVGATHPGNGKNSTTTTTTAGVSP
jgi:4-oxalocrotonate tautomerase